MKTFLTNHIVSAASMDFFAVSTLTGRVLFVLVILSHPPARCLVAPGTGEVRQLPSAGTTAVVWSDDGRSLFPLEAEGGTARLRELAIPAGSVQRVVEYGVRLRISENVAWGHRLSPPLMAKASPRR